MFYCENCGAPLEDGTVFCSECGTRVNTSQVGTTSMGSLSNVPQYQYQYQQPNQVPASNNNNSAMIVASLVVGAAIIGGAFWYTSSSDSNGGNSTTASVASKNTGNTNQKVDLSGYISVKDSFHTRISTLATDVNNSIGKYGNLKSGQALRKRARDLGREIKSKRAELEKKYGSNRYGQLLLKVYDAEWHRAAGLQKGIEAGILGGDYSEGFKYGGEWFDKFEEYDAAFNAAYWH